jgi:hypothetical protein
MMMIDDHDHDDNESILDDSECKTFIDNEVEKYIIE